MHKQTFELGLYSQLYQEGSYQKLLQLDHPSSSYNEKRWVLMTHIVQLKQSGPTKWQRLANTNH